MVTGKRSIEELLNIPEELKPGRYTLNCGVLIGTSGWVLFARCYPRVGSAPTDLQKAVMYAAKTSLFEPATRNGKRVEVFTTAATASRCRCVRAADALVVLIRLAHRDGLSG